MPVGRWQDDLQLLLDAFPQVVLEVHVSARNLAETERLSSARIDVRPVQGTARGWLLRLLRLALALPCPTIVLPGETRAEVGRAAKLVCFLSDILVGTRMGHLTLGLARLARPPE